MNTETRMRELAQAAQRFVSAVGTVVGMHSSWLDADAKTARQFRMAVARSVWYAEDVENSVDTCWCFQTPATHDDRMVWAVYPRRQPYSGPAYVMPPAGAVHDKVQLYSTTVAFSDRRVRAAPMYEGYVEDVDALFPLASASPATRLDASFIMLIPVLPSIDLDTWDALYDWTVSCDYAYHMSAAVEVVRAAAHEAAALDRRKRDTRRRSSL